MWNNMIERKQEMCLASSGVSRSLVNSMPTIRPRVREICESDLAAVGDLLTRGFVHRGRDYWMRGLARQTARTLPANAPRYGYLIEHKGIPVGCLLLIYSSKVIDGKTAAFCNLSSWYVDPEFRNYAALFASMVQKRKDVTYFNITPAVTTWPILEAQGYVSYCRGLYFSLPSLSWRGAGMTVSAVTPETAAVPALPEADLEMLRRHADYGNLSLVCSSAERALPFIFFRLRRRRGIVPVPALQLAYCPSIADFVTCAGALGRYLLVRGNPVVILDANGPVAGLPGFYSEAHGRKYFKGPHQPRLGDLADTELAIFGM
jgi:hypothetical protein